MAWFWYALLAAILLAAHFLLLKKTVSLDVPVSVVTFIAWGIAAILLGVYVLLRSDGTTLLLTPQQFLYAGLASIGFLLGALLLNKAVTIAPNPGYATAIGSVQVLIVVIVSAILLGSSLSLQKTFGAVLVVAGVILLGL